MPSRHYEVTSPEMCEYPMSWDPGPFRCWGMYLAHNKKDAVKQAVADPAFREWVREARGDKVPPFKGLIAKLAICSHGHCWGCEGDCTECLETHATAYKVWQVDCADCGTVISYTEDEHPDKCEGCGEPVEESGSSA